MCLLNKCGRGAGGALCESETAQFKGLITPAIRFRAAGSLSLSHTHHTVNIHRQGEEERGRG